MIILREVLTPEAWRGANSLENVVKVVGVSGELLTASQPLSLQVQAGENRRNYDQAKDYVGPEIRNS